MIKNLSEKPIAELQKEQAEKWEKEDLLGKCISTREGMPSFIFYEGPPTANGKTWYTSRDRQNAEGLRVPLQDHAGI